MRRCSGGRGRPGGSNGNPPAWASRCRTVTASPPPAWTAWGTGSSRPSRPDETAARAASEVISLVTEATSNSSVPPTPPRKAVSVPDGDTTATPARPTGQSNSQFTGPPPWGSPNPSGSSVPGLLQPPDGGGVVFGEQGGGVGAAPVRLDAGAEQAAAGLQLGLSSLQLVGGGRRAGVGDVTALVGQDGRDPLGGGVALLELGVDEDLGRPGPEPGRGLVDRQLELGEGDHRPGLLEPVPGPLDGGGRAQGAQLGRGRVQQGDLAGGADQGHPVQPGAAGPASDQPAGVGRQEDGDADLADAVAEALGRRGAPGRRRELVGDGPEDADQGRHQDHGRDGRGQPQPPGQPRPGPGLESGRLLRAEPPRTPQRRQPRPPEPPHRGTPSGFPGPLRRRPLGELTGHLGTAQSGRRRTENSSITGLASRASAMRRAACSPSPSRTVSSTCLPMRTSETPSKPSAGRARSTAWPCGSRISRFSITSTATRGIRAPPGFGLPGEATPERRHDPGGLVRTAGRNRPNRVMRQPRRVVETSA